MKLSKQTLRRALRTFLQAALSYMLVNIAAADSLQDFDALKTTLVGLAVASVAAGLAAVMNLEQK